MNPACSRVAIAVHGGRKRSTGAQGRTFPAFLCLSDAARRSAALLLGTTSGEGVETVGLGGVEGLISSNGKKRKRSENRV